MPEVPMGRCDAMRLKVEGRKDEKDVELGWKT